MNAARAVDEHRIVAAKSDQPIQSGSAYAARKLRKTDSGESLIVKHLWLRASRPMTDAGRQSVVPFNRR
jgi:hypothetical protein